MGQNPILWILPDSEVLGGYYMSAVVVLGSSRDEAVEIACAEFDRHATKQITDYGFHPRLDCFPEDPEHPAALEALKAAFRDEVETYLEELGSDCRFFLRS